MNQEALIYAARPEPVKKINYLFIAGTGAVGGTLIEQLSGLDSPYVFKMLGSCNSQRYVIDQQTFEPESTFHRLQYGQETDWKVIIQKLIQQRKDPLIFVDATGSEEVARLYPRLMEAGFHIATPSKLANTFEQSYYDILQKTASENSTFFRYEPTVGAGLPILSTLTDLIESGDVITEISGVLSGTMTYLFNELENGTPFSKAVIQARELGYAEPDPRDDLSGEDVARKFLTLARTIGLHIERHQLQVESLIPRELDSVDRDTFLKKLEEYDNHWIKKMDRAQQEGKTLRYTGKLTGGDVEVSTRPVPQNSAIGRLQGTDNLVHIYTNRYQTSPIIIQGPGAGKEVTASGVLADVLKIAKSVRP